MRCHSVAVGMQNRMRSATLWNTRSITAGHMCCDLRCRWQCDRNALAQGRFQRVVTLSSPHVWIGVQLYPLLCQPDTTQQISKPRVRAQIVHLGAGQLGPIVDLDYMTRGLAQFQMDKEGKLNLLRLSTVDGQAYEFRRE